MPRRRWIIRWLVAPLLLGVVTTVAVSWGLAAWLPQRSWVENRIKARQDALFLREYHIQGAYRRAWGCWVGTHLSNSELSPFAEVIDNPLVCLGSESSLALRGPRWGAAEAVRDEAHMLPPTGMEHATGWPSVAVWYGVSASFDNSTLLYRYDVEGGIPLRIPSGSGFPIDDISTLRALPYRPIWPGIIINTLFYAALWIVPLAGIRAARRAWRRHRHRCPACAYRLAGLSPRDGTLTCPECGHSQRTRAPTVITPPREAASTLPSATGGKAGTTEKA